jgi:hypothetical protein
LLGLEGNDLGGGKSGVARLKPWPARQRNSAMPLAFGPKRTWHWWLVRNLTAYAGACVCSKAQAQERVASTRGCAASMAGRHRAARRHGWGGWHQREAMRACTRMGVRAQEQPGARTTQVERHHGGRRLGSPRQNASELGSVEEHRDKGSGFSLPRLTCARARVHGRVDKCEGVCVRASRPQPRR